MPWGFCQPSQTPTAVCSCVIHIAELCPGKEYDELSRTSDFLQTLIISGDLFPFPVHGKLSPGTTGLVDWRRWVGKALTSCSVPLFIFFENRHSLTPSYCGGSCVWVCVCVKSNILVHGVKAPTAHRFWAVIWMVTWPVGRKETLTLS